MDAGRGFTFASGFSWGVEVRPLRGSLYVKRGEVRARDSFAAQRAGCLEANVTQIASGCAPSGQSATLCGTAPNAIREFVRRCWDLVEREKNRLLEERFEREGNAMGLQVLAELR